MTAPPNNNAYYPTGGGLSPVASGLAPGLSTLMGGSGYGGTGYGAPFVDAGNPFVMATDDDGNWSDSDTSDEDEAENVYFLENEAEPDMGAWSVNTIGAYYYQKYKFYKRKFRSFVRKPPRRDKGGGKSKGKRSTSYFAQPSRLL